MSTETRPFHIGDILSVTTGKLVSPDHIDGVYKILGWMTGESLMTHQLPRVAREAEPFLREWFPDLAAVETPENGWGGSKEAVFAWLDGVVAELGETRDVPRLPVDEHTSIDPIRELQMHFPGKPIIAVDLGEER